MSRFWRFPDFGRLDFGALLLYSALVNTQIFIIQIITLVKARVKEDKVATMALKSLHKGRFN